MKIRRFLLVALATLTLWRPAALKAQPSTDDPAGLLFIENVGQFPAEARFLARDAEGDALWLTRNAVWLSTDEGAVKLSFRGANPRPRLTPFARQNVVLNYYHSSDPANWHPAVPVWGGVRYGGLYPGVDLEIYGEGMQWRWRLVAERADRLAAVQLAIGGADEVVARDGALQLRSPAGDLTLPLLTVSDPDIIAQPTATPTGTEFIIRNPFALHETQHGRVTTRRAPRDAPDALLYSTFLGGTSDDEALAIAVDDNGEVYVTGNTYSPDFPTTPGAFDTSFDGECEVFVSRLNADGSALLYSTFLGGTSDVEDRPDERVWDIAVDETGTAYITGEARTDDFPTTPGAFDTSYNPGYDLPEDPPEANPFVTKLNGAGALVYSTYLGPSGEGKGIAVDAAGMIYVAGRTGSEWFPTTEGAYDRSLALSGDFFVMKLNPEGNGQNDLRYSTYVGLEAQDFPQDIAVDEAGVVYVVGITWGEFPTTPGAYDTTPGEAVFFKLNPAGNGAADLRYATYLDALSIYAIAVDAAGRVYLTGGTENENFPTTPGAFDTSYNDWGDAYIVKLNPAGNGTADLLYSTFLGGDDIEWGGRALAVDDSGDIYVVGSSYSDDFPVTPGAYQSALQDQADLFVTRLRPEGAGEADLVYSTYLGGGDLDDGYSVALGQEDSAYVAGRTASPDFPTTPGAYDTTYSGGDCGERACYDGIVARMRVAPSSSIAGTVQDRDGNPIFGLRISAGGTYSATTDNDGAYTITGLPAGTYTVTPALPEGFFWEPERRVVTLPPSAVGQDFARSNFIKQSSVPALEAVSFGEALTYTLRLLYPYPRDLILTDAVPTYTTYIAGTLSAPTGIAYEAATGAISGTLGLEAATPVTITFAVQVALTGTAGFAPSIVNRACVYPQGGSVVQCEWSNEVSNTTYTRSVYLPLIARNLSLEDTK